MTAVYRFGSFELQPNERRLLSEGRPVALGQRAFDVLVALVERAGRLVPKDELLGLVWPGVVVEDNNLQVQVSTLRKVLGPAAITTTAGRGYRFTLPLAPAAESSSSPGAQRHNLPRQLTSFVGHDDDLDEYAALLQQTRLLTLTGIGGCGKTRLAIKLAERLVDSFPDGVWYVDMAPLLDAERVPLTIATALGIREENERPLVDTLCARLAGQCALLVIDNCEHLVAACAALVQRLLSSAAAVRVLAASREGLGVPGDRTVTVRSLSFPPRGSKPDLQALQASEAVRLFVERAELSVPDFALTEDTAGAVAEICRRLEGIPLAIELAAARVKMLSVEEIRSRLDDRFRLLTGGSKAGMARQQTLLATIQWSYDHLAPDQQALLRRLSVFVGGWTLDGALRVAAGPLDEYAVLDLLTRLVDQSLVSTHRAAGGSTRYSMLETVRQYAHDRLHDATELEAARKRHLDFYVALAEEAEPELVGPEQAAWLARLDPELENFLAAHARCDRAEDLALPGLRLVFSLNAYFLHRGLLALGQQVTVEALVRTEAQDRNLARCRALWAAGNLSYFMGRYGEARDFVEMSLTISREIPDEGRAAEALRLLGYVFHALKDAGTARALSEEALSLSRILGNKQQISGALNVLAETYRAAGELDKSRSLYEESLALHRERGDRAGIAISLANLAWISMGLGLGDQARRMVREGLAIAEALASKRAGSVQLECTTALAGLCGDWERAARLHGATSALSEQLGFHREPVEAATLAHWIARARNALGAAAFTAVESAGRALSYDEAIEEARSWLELQSGHETRAEVNEIDMSSQ